MPIHRRRASSSKMVRTVSWLRLVGSSGSWTKRSKRPLARSRRLKPPCAVPTQSVPERSSWMARTQVPPSEPGSSASWRKRTSSPVSGSSRFRPCSVPTQSLPERSSARA